MSKAIIVLDHKFYINFDFEYWLKLYLPTDWRKRSTENLFDFSSHHVYYIFENIILGTLKNNNIHTFGLSDLHMLRETIELRVNEDE